MGIPTCRFIGDKHELFVCAICLDVAADPVATNDCDHMFCNSCLEEADSAQCPSCREELKNPKWSPIKGSIKRIYTNLQLKCLTDSCAHVLDTSSYAYHDENCAFAFKNCDECGCKIKWVRDGREEHSCIKILQKKIKMMEERMKNMGGKSAADIEAMEGRMKKFEEKSNLCHDLHLAHYAMLIGGTKMKQLVAMLNRSKDAIKYDAQLTAYRTDANEASGGRKKWIEGITEFLELD